MAKKKAKQESLIKTKKELEDLQPEEKSNYVAQLIAEVADEAKKPPSEVNWLDFRDHIKYHFGQNTHGLLPRLITQLGGFARIRDAHFPKEVTNDHLERVALMESARINRAYANKEAYDEYFLSKLKETMNSSDYAPKIKTFKVGRRTKTQRVLNLVLSDIHYQSLILRSETGHSYGATEEARRTSYIARTVANYKLDHRNETELAVWLLGDIIQNTLYDSRDGSPIAEQVAAAKKYLIELIGHFATAFPKVTIYCSTGNHGRNTARHKQRAIHQKWDSLETGIYDSLKNFFSATAKNVTFVIPKTPWVEAEILGHPIYATHGDTTFSPGNPGKAVNTEKFQVQVNNINAARELKEEKPFEVFLCGHVHRGMNTFLDNGVMVFTNPPLCPPDGFAVSIGINSTQCGQWMFETTKDYAVGDFRMIRLGEAQDKDKSLNEVKPYEGGFDHVPEVVQFKKK